MYSPEGVVIQDHHFNASHSNQFKLALERARFNTRSKPDTKSDFAIGAGTETGLQATYDLRYGGSEDTQVIIVHVNPLSAN